MKKIIVIALVALACHCANAQESKHELSVGVGYGTSCQLYDIVGDMFKAFVGCEDHHRGFDGSYNLDYGYHVSPKIVITGSVSLSHIKSHMYSTGEDKQFKGSASNTFIAVMPGFKYNWIDKEHFALYSRAAVGVHVITATTKQETSTTTSDQDDSPSCAVAYQLSPIGTEFGSQLRGFVEFGFGANGLIGAGLRYRF